MPTQYDPSLLQKFAENLYSKAQSMTISHAVWGAALFGCIGFFASSAIRTDTPLWLMGAALGGLICGWIGYNKAFALRLEAQRTLCQMKIAERLGVIADSQVLTASVTSTESMSH